jgi:hypothetical protein
MTFWIVIARSKATKQSILPGKERMDCFASFAMTSDTASRSRRTSARVLSATSRPLPSEGAGNAGCTLHPRSRVQITQQMRTRAYRFSGGNPTFPAQWCYGLLRALLGDRAFCHHHREKNSANLTPASRRQDHTTSPSASGALVRSAIRVHRIPPHVRDDRETPL